MLKAIFFTMIHKKFMEMLSQFFFTIIHKKIIEFI